LGLTANRSPIFFFSNRTPGRTPMNHKEFKDLITDEEVAIINDAMDIIEIYDNLAKQIDQSLSGENLLVWCLNIAGEH
jgi:hypothetical protein